MNINSFNTPILFLIFNREDTSFQVLEAIKKVKPAKLYIASDGSRDHVENEFETCQKLREQILSSINWSCEIKTLFRDKNLGCKIAVSSAIDWFFEHEEYGIILEDDCLPNHSFFFFIQELLLKYQNNFNIGMISGNNFIPEYKVTDSYLFSYHCHIWGWGTWRRAWKLYDISLSSWNNTALTTKYSNKSELQYWNNIFKKIKNNEINTWDYQWVYTCISNDLLSIIPSHNLVQNIGFDERATHTKTVLDFYNVSSSEINFPIIHPEVIKRNQKADILIFNKLFKPKSLLKRALNKLQILN